MSAGFRWTVSSQPRVLVLNKPMAFEPAPAHRKNRWAVDSLDYSAREVISIASGRMEVEATIKFEKNAQGLVDMLRDAADGNVVTYYPDLSNGTGYALWLVSETTELAPQAGNWSLGNYEVRTRWRDASASGTSIAPLFERLLFRLDAGHFPLGYSFTRSGTARYVDADGVLKSAAENIARLSWPLVDGVRTPALLLERAAENDIWPSAPDVSGSARWTSNAAWTQSSVSSFVQGGTAYEYTNDGATSSHLVTQDTPALVGTSVVASCIIENVSAVTSEIAIRDTTANDWVIRARYTWATDAIVEVSSGVGSSVGVRRTVLAESGPNGGKLVRLECYGIADNPTNTGGLYLYPCGVDVNSTVAILHHAQHEDGTVATSPIVTTTAAASHLVESFRLPFVHAPQAMTIYASLIEQGNTGTAGVIQIGESTGASDARIGIATSSSTYRAFYNNGSGFAQTSAPSSSPAVGDPFELLLTITSAGVVTLAQSIDAAAAEVETGPTGALPSSWNSQHIYFNSTGTSNTGLSAIRSVKVAPGTKTLAEMRAL